MIYLKILFFILITFSFIIIVYINFVIAFSFIIKEKRINMDTTKEDRSDVLRDKKGK